MKYLWTTISVKNMDESVKFYTEIVGLPLNRRFTSPTGMEISFLGSEETKVELIYGVEREVPGNIEGISIGFEVESLDKMIKFLDSKGIQIAGGPFQPTPNISYLYIKDPNGVKVQLVENK